MQYISPTWVKLASPSISLVNFRFNPISNDLIIWNNATGQWQAWNRNAGILSSWLSVGTFPTSICGGQGLNSIGPLIGTQAATYVQPDAVNGQLMTLNAGGSPLFGQFKAAWFNVETGAGPGGQYYLPQAMNAAFTNYGTPPLMMNRYYPNCVFVAFSYSNSQTQGMFVGFDISTGLPAAVILTDLTYPLNMWQNGSSNGAIPPMPSAGQAGQGMPPGAMMYVKTIDSVPAAQYMPYFFDFYNYWSVPSPLFLNTRTSQVNSSSIINSYPVSLLPPLFDLTTPFFPTTAPGFNAFLPASKYGGAQLARNSASLESFGAQQELGSFAFQGPLSTVFVTYSGGSGVDLIFLPYVNGLIGLPLAVPLPAGLNNSAGSFVFGVLGGEAYILDTSGNFYVLGLLGYEFSNYLGVMNWRKLNAF